MSCAQGGSLSSYVIYKPCARYGCDRKVKANIQPESYEAYRFRRQQAFCEDCVRIYCTPCWGDGQSWDERYGRRMRCCFCSGTGKIQPIRAVQRTYGANEHEPAVPSWAKPKKEQGDV